LKEVEFGYNFNQQIDLSNCLQLTKITFGLHFNQSIDLLPNTIQYLKLGNSFTINDSSIFEKFKFLRELKLGSTFENELPKLAEKLQHIKISIGNPYY